MLPMCSVWTVRNLEVTEIASVITGPMPVKDYNGLRFCEFFSVKTLHTIAVYHKTIPFR